MENKEISVLLSSWMQWQWQWSVELCQRWQPQTSATGNVISWNFGPLGIHAVQPYIAQAMRKKAAIVMLQEIRIPRGSKFRVSEISGGNIQSTNVTLLQAAILT